MHIYVNFLIKNDINFPSHFLVVFLETEQWQAASNIKMIFISFFFYNMGRKKYWNKSTKHYNTKETNKENQTKPNITKEKLKLKYGNSNNYIYI